MAGIGLDEGHPLVGWYAALRRAEAASVEGTDIVLGDLGGKRFALGVAEGPIPVLAHLPEDGEALMSVRWTSAAIVRGRHGRDWIALSCRDARVRGSPEPKPVPLRLWVPVTLGRLDPWAAAKPASLRIHAMSGPGRAPEHEGPAEAEIPLKVMS